MTAKTYTNWLLVILAIVAILTVGASGCQPQAASMTKDEGEPPEIIALSPVILGDGEKLQIVATTNIVGDVVSRVGGDRIALTTLTNVGVDPHSYVPTPADTAALHDAHAVFANGAGLEEFLAEMLDSAGGDAVEIHVSEELDLQGAEDAHDHEGGDSHVWFDVQNVIRWVEAIEEALVTLDPTNTEAYQANADAYVRQLEELDTWVVAQVATIPSTSRKFVTNHPAFGYLAERYGLEQVGAVYPISPSSEPSAQDLAALEEAIHEHGAPAVFTESTVNPKLAEQVAQDTGVKLVPLYTGSLGGPGSGVESYIELIRYDVTAIVEALK
jgi:ABC-type Zn uptake system ZnuABC Zn-binding protein ZnuA